MNNLTPTKKKKKNHKKTYPKTKYMAHAANYHIHAQSNVLVKGYADRLFVSMLYCDHTLFTILKEKKKSLKPVVNIDFFYTTIKMITY